LKGKSYRSNYIKLDKNWKFKIQKMRKWLRNYKKNKSIAVLKIKLRSKLIHNKKSYEWYEYKFNSN